MLRVDPASGTEGLAEIITSRSDRITEARANGWLGEGPDLQDSLGTARSKMNSLARVGRAAATRPTSVFPVIRASW
jgi:hypothetical protein